jgi:tetrapyrrole methylase family protein/MazG family protein
MITPNKNRYSMEDLLALMNFLRSDNGCPWDKEQTHLSLRKNVVEEAYEVVDAIDEQAPERLADELGDLLLQVILHSQIASEHKEFDFTDVADHLSKKLISRHTHLFGENLDKADSPEKVLALWENNKKTEKNHQKQTQAMKEIPRAFPSLLRAYKIQKKANHVGFDWEDRRDVLAKITEETGEAEAAARKWEQSAKEDAAQNKKDVEMEIGDLLFAVVNYARFLEVDPEIALDKANRKFIDRFGFVEEKVLAAGKKMEQMTLAELDMIWNEAKEKE